MSTYTITGPTFDQLNDFRKLYHNPNELIARLKGLDQVEVFRGNFVDMKNLFLQERLFLAEACGYHYHVVNHDTGKQECEIYPQGNWLSIMQSPKMTPQAIQSADQDFLRLMNPQDVGNFAHVPVMFRGLETRAIAQVFTHEDIPALPEDENVLRPMWVMIDPFLLSRLGPARGLETSDKAIKEKHALNDAVASAPNVVPIGGGDK